MALRFLLGIEQGGVESVRDLRHRVHLFRFQS